MEPTPSRPAFTFYPTTRCDPVGVNREIEEIAMFAGFVAHAKRKVTGWAQALVKAVKSLVEPARSGTVAAAGVARDDLRGRVHPIAENAFLRQQLIVLRRNVGRPVFVRGERLALVLLAWVSSAWKDALSNTTPAKSFASTWLGPRAMLGFAQQLREATTWCEGRCI